MSRRGDWWANTGHAQAKREQDERDGRPTDGGFDMMSAFFHDVPPEVVAEAIARRERDQSATPFKKPAEEWFASSTCPRLSVFQTRPH